MTKKEIQKELINAVGDIKKYLQDKKYIDRDEPVFSSMVSNESKPKAEQLNIIRNKVARCKKCPLHKTRIKTVFGEGDPDSAVMFIGEGPGYDEDRAGKPFIGRAGQLLTKIIESIGLKREKVYITNIVKCHPLLNPEKIDIRGNDRPPTKDEIDTCLPYLARQIEIINPKIVCTLGSPAGRTLLNTTEPITRFRGRLSEYNGKKLIPTYHPAALLRNPNLKPAVWEDMKLLRSLLKK